MLCAFAEVVFVMVIVPAYETGIEHLRQEAVSGIGVDFGDSCPDARGIPCFCGQHFCDGVFADTGDDAGNAADEGFSVSSDEVLFGSRVVARERTEVQRGFCDLDFAAVNVFAGLREEGGGGRAWQAQQDAVSPGKYPENGKHFAVRVAAGSVGPATFGEDVHVAGELSLQEGAGVNTAGFQYEGIVFHHMPRC